jgi:hypothetical protein
MPPGAILCDAAIAERPQPQDLELAVLAASAGFAAKPRKSALHAIAATLKIGLPILIAAFIEKHRGVVP